MPTKSINNLLDLALASNSTALQPRQRRKAQKARPQADVSNLAFKIKTIKEINEICGRYEEGVPERVGLYMSLGQFIKNAEAIDSQASVTIISQACSMLTKRKLFLQHLSYRVLTVAYKLELKRINTLLDNVLKFISERGLTGEESKSIRAVKHAIAKPLPKQPKSAGDLHPEAGVTNICTLRRSADWLRQRKQEFTDERSDAMVRLLKESATVAGRAYRLAIQLEIMKLDKSIDFRTKKLDIREALGLL